MTIYPDSSIETYHPKLRAKRPLKVQKKATLMNIEFKGYRNLE